MLFRSRNVVDPKGVCCPTRFIIPLAIAASTFAAPCAAAVAAGSGAGGGFGADGAPMNHVTFA